MHDRLKKLVSCAAPLVLAAGAPGQAHFTGLGDLPGGTFSSRARAVSVDGLIVAGVSHSSNGTTGPDGCCEAFIWMWDSGLTPLGDLPGGAFESEVLGLSADGSAAVGGGHIGVDLAFRWTSGGGIIGLPELDGGPYGGAVAAATSADGLTVVGWDAGPNGREAFRIRVGDFVAMGLGDLAGGEFWSEATGISANGTVIAGSSKSALGTEAFVWTAGSGMQALGDLEGGEFSSRALAISADGQVVVGWGSSADGVEAFRWTQAAGLIGLGDLGGGLSEARAVSADGSVIVGRSFDHAGEEAATIWTAETGTRNLRDVLEAEHGLDITGWTLIAAQGISADGRVIAGRGRNPQGDTEAWVARLGTACYADFTGDGVLDLFDFLAFVNAFNAGSPEADCLADGLLDLFDFLCFVNAFNEGC
jgi:probable HAF family extracellular repeat protein